MIIPVVEPIYVFGDDSFDLVMNWKDENDLTIDLSARTAEMVFYVSKTDRTVVKTLTTTPNVGGSVIVLAATDPNISVLIVRGETGIGSSPDFTAEPGYFLLRIIQSTTLDDRLLEGKVYYKA